MHGWEKESDSSLIPSENVSKEDVATTLQILPDTLQGASTMGTTAATASVQVVNCVIVENSTNQEIDRSELKDCTVKNCAKDLMESNQIESYDFTF